MSTPADIRLQVMWNRLLSVVEEQARALVRTAFSTSAREAGDISAGVFDLEGRMLAQAVTGTPAGLGSGRSVAIDRVQVSASTSSLGMARPNTVS